MSIFFDLLILILLIATSMPAFFLLRNIYYVKNSWEYKHKKITLIISSLLVLCFVLVVYGSFIEPKIIIVREEKIDLPKINKPIRIALVADFQVGPYKQTEFVKRVSEKINSLNPDLVLIAGDQVNNSGNFDGDVKYLSALKYLSDKVPAYAVNGNHEYGVSDNASLYDYRYRTANLSDQTKKELGKAGVKYLVNEMEVLEINGQKFNLFGGDSYWAQRLDLSALRKKTNDLTTISLIHNPAAVSDVDGNGVDLMLSGHTHGGQIRLPFIGPIVTVDKTMPRKWHKGWVDYKNTKMYVTSGIGETGVRARLFTPPEIVMLTIY